MDVFFLMQILVNLFLGIGLYVIWLRLRRPPQEDPRLSRGLQLLQSKISILEDLSDRTDKQVHQIVQILEQKSQQIQKKIQDSNSQMQKMEQAMHKSNEVARIFQDKIPHAEIIERQNTVKYIKAAQLAHKGATADNISETLDIPKSEAEFIAKVNRDRLMFDEDQLPEWAKQEILRSSTDAPQPNESIHRLNFENENLINNIKEKESSLKEIGNKFKQACTDFDDKETMREQLEKEKELLSSGQFMTSTLNSAEAIKNTVAEQAKKMALNAPKLSVSKILEASKRSAKPKNTITRNIGIERAVFPEITNDKTKNKTEVKP